MVKKKNYQSTYYLVGYKVYKLLSDVKEKDKMGLFGFDSRLNTIVSMQRMRKLLKRLNKTINGERTYALAA